MSIFRKELHSSWCKTGTILRGKTFFRNADVHYASPYSVGRFFLLLRKRSPLTAHVSPKDHPSVCVQLGDQYAGQNEEAGSFLHGQSRGTYGFRLPERTPSASSSGAFP